MQTHYFLPTEPILAAMQTAALSGVDIRLMLPERADNWITHLGSRSYLADVMQETTLSAWEHLGELKKAAYFKTWLTRILINNCNNVLRERKRCIATKDFSMQGEEPQAKTDAEFYEMLSCLPEKYKHIFLLYYGQGFRTREIAEILDLSENTVKSRLRRGRESLKSQLIL